MKRTIKSIGATLLMFAMSILLLQCGGSSITAPTADFRIVPLPEEATPASGEFVLTPKTTIVYPESDMQQKRNAEFLQQYIKENLKLDLEVTASEKGGNSIVFEPAVEGATPDAANYSIKVSPDKVAVSGTAAGCFYACQTLRKALPITEEAAAEVKIPCVTVNDKPRFEYRGAHFDVSRHFFTVDEVKRFIDLLVLHNINRLHWHITDDQGWRVEIKKYPKLTEIGAYRPETVIGHNTGKYDGTPHEGYYTQEQIRDIVKYAAERYITIVPEVDLPGHMQAALAAYPELGCTGGPYEVWKMWGVSTEVLCAGNDKVLEFITDVFNEICDLFPSEYVHVGGDECPKDRWKECPKCQKRIADNKLHAADGHTAEERLQSYIIQYASKELAKRGRKIIGWDEILEGGLSKDATVMSWRGESGGIKAANMGNKVIMTPNTYLYFDYYQTQHKENEPIAIGGFLPIERTYSYEPVPDDLDPQLHHLIFGVQANLWTEYIPNFKQVEYMELPRMAALCEVQWRPRGTKDYPDFLNRLQRMIKMYDMLDYNYARHIYEVSVSYRADLDKHAAYAEVSTIDDAPVYYTLDGTEPTTESARYTGELEIKQDCHLRIAAFRPEGKTRTVGEKFSFNKATARPITFLQPSCRSYTFGGAPTLVDGMDGGGTNIRNSRWIGFEESDLDAVVDLGEGVSFSSVSINTYVDASDWVFASRGMQVAVSNDGTTWQVVAENERPAMASADEFYGIVPEKLTFPTQTARYMKVMLKSEHSIPEWHGAKGKPGFLFVDEIVVE